MENLQRYSRSSKQRRSGYEPSDTETDWHDTPRHEYTWKNDRRNTSPMPVNRRRHSKSPYKQHRDDAPKPTCDVRRSVSPFAKPERQRHVSPYKDPKLDDDPMIQKPRRPVSAQRLRARENGHTHTHTEQTRERTPSPMPRTVKGPSVGEINEMIANAKLSKTPPNKTLLFESTDSIAPGDIFFSHDYKLHTNTTPPARFTTLFRNDSTPHPKTAPNARFEGNTKVTSTCALSRQSSDVMSSGSSKKSYGSGRTTESMRKFAANRQKSQSEPWFACMRRPCITSKQAESKPSFDESTFIQKAFVVESLREFWADKHRPGSLNGFTCHKQEAQLLKHLVSQDIFPHILFKGPAGSGKKALTMALLREVYGDPSWNISHDLRYFQIQEKRSAQVAVPLASSAHHMELNVNFELNASYALMALVKEICSNHAISPEVSNVNFKADCKVMVLYGVDKAAESIQHLIKWIMDCYTDACKLILCCEDDINILDSVKSRCKIIKVDAPVTHEIMEVLIQIARKEDFDLPMSFAAKIATKSKQNLRKAIMALEACKANKYPFLDDQPIPFGWEEVLVELAAEILADPSTKRLFDVRGKFQKLLVDFVHPKLILQKLVEEFLKKIDASLKREVYYWHAYYEKRLPAGTSALLKLEEFVAKFMSICRKANINC